MTTRERHMARSRRSHGKIYFKSEDKAYHELSVGLLGQAMKVYKDHQKKYDGKGRRIV